MPSKTVYTQNPELWKEAQRFVRFYKGVTLSRYLDTHLAELVAELKREHGLVKRK